MSKTQVATPFEQIGGTPAITALVERFYDLMDSDPDYAELRAIHARDLAPMRTSLAGFLTGWAGGPRDWFEQNPGKCMMSAHSQIPISARTAQQWLSAMNRAFADCGLADHPVGRLMTERFAMMADGMKNIAVEAD